MNRIECEQLNEMLAAIALADENDHTPLEDLRNWIVNYGLERQSKGWNQCVNKALYVTRNTMDWDIAAAVYVRKRLGMLEGQHPAQVQALAEVAGEEE